MAAAFWLNADRPSDDEPSAVSDPSLVIQRWRVRQQQGSGSHLGRLLHGVLGGVRDIAYDPEPVTCLDRRRLTG